MKRIAAFTVIFALALPLAAPAQDNSLLLDAGSDAGSVLNQPPAIQAGDPGLATQRILSSTQYRVTPGDVYRLSITTDAVTTYTLTLQENYDIEVPYLGTISAKGMLFSDLRRRIVDSLKKILKIVQYIDLSLTSVSRFDVTVFGGVNAPGIITAMPLSRVSDAITQAGKVKPGFSSRQISLMRGGRTITVDLQRYATTAESDDNPYLEPGDRIFVPQARVMVSIIGQVRYAGTYEIIPGESLATAIGYAGGIVPGGRADAIELMQFRGDEPQADGGGHPSPIRSVRTLSLSADGGTPLANGDRIRVPSQAENRSMILVTGALFGSTISADRAVKIPTTAIAVDIPYSPNLTLLSVLESLGGPTPYAQAQDSVILRKSTGQRILVDVDALWSARASAADVPLEPGDVVSVPLVTDVFVAGEVNAAGKFPYNPAGVVSDYLVAAGGIKQDTSNANCLYFSARDGKLTKTSLTAAVKPGALIVVKRNAFQEVTAHFTEITTVTAFVTTILAFVTTSINFAARIKLGL
jgi:polysaccharide biosynthesis/export protein